MKNKINNKYSVNLCLNYHDFSGTKANFQHSNYTVEFNAFKKQIELIKSFRNLNVIDLLTNETLNELSVSPTFDDGLKSNLYIAEELAKNGLTGTFFIIKNKCLNDSAYLDVNELKELLLLGMEIGSHSCTHRHMNRLPDNELKTELRESKSFLEDITGRSINSIAFPGGQCGNREFEFAIKEGYLINRSTMTGINYLPLNNGIVKCMTIKNEIDIEVFKNILELSAVYYGKIKMREIILSFPKYIQSHLIAYKERNIKYA